jgi:hypothetical protein
MCNPRRITVQATRQIAEAWRAAVERTARLSARVSGRARLSQPLGAMLAPRARAAFEQAVGGDDAWRLRDGAYHLDVPGGMARYDPGSGELTVEVELSEVVEVVETASEEVTGTVNEEFQATAEGMYYTDEYGGRTEERARREASELAGTEAERLAREHAAEIRARADQAARDAAAAREQGVQHQADEQARRSLEEAGRLRRADLDAEALRQLEMVREVILRGVWRTVGRGYQHLLLTYARDHGATGISVTEEGGSLGIQFEMEA